MAPYGIYATSDGYLALAMNSLGVLGELLDLPDVASYEGDPQGAFTDRDTIKRRLEGRLLTRNTNEWLELMAVRDIWCAPVKDFEAIFDDPQVKAAEIVATVDHPNIGPLKVIRTPICLSETPPTIRRPCPRVGEHNQEIMRELGYNDSRIAQLEKESCDEQRSGHF
jgi:crotonobetainyl-CoA:carnitine CoA-transferase CaiB-like acyl-CoA transferase